MPSLFGNPNVRSDSKVNNILGHQYDDLDSMSDSRENNSLQGQFPAFVVQLLEPVEAVAAVIILQAWLTLPSCLANSSNPTLARMIFCSWVMS